MTTDADREALLKVAQGRVPMPTPVDTAPEGEVLEADDTVPVERLAHWLHGEYGGPFDWHRTEEHIRENYRRTARALMSQLPELFR